MISARLKVQVHLGWLPIFVRKKLFGQIELSQGDACCVALLLSRLLLEVEVELKEWSQSHLLWSQ